MENGLYFSIFHFQFSIFFGKGLVFSEIVCNFAKMLNIYGL